MVFDSKTGSIYVLGRLSDGDLIDAHEFPGDTRHLTQDSRISDAFANAATRLSQHMAGEASGSAHGSDFYRYHTRGLDAGKWDLLAFDTAATGGPPLISDHQMEIDCERQMIYVFGGRAGHSMVLDTKSQTLLIFGGQREDRYLSDMFAFHIPTSTVTELYSNFSAAGGPDPCFTQRAVIDVDTQEIYIFGGLTRSKPSAPPVLESESPYWIYRYDRPDIPGKWSKLVPEKDAESSWPQPRYAHQVVYDAKSKTVYMHGGNGGLDTEDTPSDSETRGGEADDDGQAQAGDMKRLDDFWRLEIVRPSEEEITRRALFEVRKQQFREMCEDGPPIKALTFLQTKVSEVVNHDDPEEAKAFRLLLSTHLLSAFPRAAVGDPMPSSGPPSVSGPSTVREDSPPPRKRSRPSSPEPAASASNLVSVVRWETDPSEAEGGAPSPERFRQRTEMFERLMVFINEDAKQPDKNLIDMISDEVSWVVEQP
ncbi:hypothetical protein BN946_scf184281.g18 [Trametes cinnabarina]|uniref:Muskelin N-terminal domain-containing protein n=1 Tax=Pycnoporus cinnabarinus TaxID=5643 RepID=A0A060SS26_PYCCI|nr:hypothetical protein BN946_scf184281.g18 [Trametes cinnabarina]